MADDSKTAETPDEQRERYDWFRMKARIDHLVERTTRLERACAELLEQRDAMDKVRDGA